MWLNTVTGSTLNCILHDIGISESSQFTIPCPGTHFDLLQSSIVSIHPSTIFYDFIPADQLSDSTLRNMNWEHERTDSNLNDFICDHQINCDLSGLFKHVCWALQNASDIYWVVIGGLARFREYCHHLNTTFKVIWGCQ